MTGTVPIGHRKLGNKKNAIHFTKNLLPVTRFKKYQCAPLCPVNKIFIYIYISCMRKALHAVCAVVISLVS